MNLFNQDRQMCKDAIADMAKRKDLGPVEFLHISRADVNTVGPYESCELHEEAPLLSELGWRQEKTGTTVSYEVMSPLFWEKTQEQRFMLVRSQGENGVSVNTWLKQEEAEEVDAQSCGSEEARWRPMNAEDFDPLPQLSLGGMINGMGWNEMNDDG